MSDYQTMAKPATNLKWRKTLLTNNIIMYDANLQKLAEYILSYRDLTILILLVWYAIYNSTQWTHWLTLSYRLYSVNLKQN